MLAAPAAMTVPPVGDSHGTRQMSDGGHSGAKSVWNPARFYETGNLKPVLVFAGTFAAYVACIGAVGFTSSLLGKALFAVALCFLAGRLFLIGHDACHGSFARKRFLCAMVGRLSLTAASHVFCSWRYWHNIVHHGSTNDLDKDFVWRPLSKPEYDRASRLNRALERLFRHHSGAGLGVYYLLRILLPKMLHVPRAGKRMAGATPVRDLAIFYAFQIAVLAWLAGAALLLSEGQGAWTIGTNLLCGSIVPTLYVCYAIGFVVYFNHTHPTIDWFRGAAQRSFTERQTDSTLHLRFRGLSAWMLPSEIMGHVVHHLDTRIPLYRLQEAQAHLAASSPTPVKADLWSWRTQRKIMRTCKLYDPLQRCWIGFDGQALERN
jgi:omega-6 fatty acid desaturase (delta-12 desaturase)